MFTPPNQQLDKNVKDDYYAVPLELKRRSVDVIPEQLEKQQENAGAYVKF